MFDAGLVEHQMGTLYQLDPGRGGAGVMLAATRSAQGPAQLTRMRAETAQSRSPTRRRICQPPGWWVAPVMRAGQARVAPNAAAEAATAAVRRRSSVRASR